MEQVALILGGLAAFLFVHYRMQWYAKQRRLWLELVSQYNRAMIEWCVQNNQPFSIGPVLQQNLPNYHALGEYGHKEWDLRVWSLDGLAVDRIAFNTVMRWHEQRLKELQ